MPLLPRLLPIMARSSPAASSTPAATVATRQVRAAGRRDARIRRRGSRVTGRGRGRYSPPRSSRRAATFRAPSAGTQHHKISLHRLFSFVEAANGGCAVRRMSRRMLSQLRRPLFRPHAVASQSHHLIEGATSATVRRRAPTRSYSPHKIVADTNHSAGLQAVPYSAEVLARAFRVRV
jgi:hypothetical protein